MSLVTAIADNSAPHRDPLREAHRSAGYWFGVGLAALVLFFVAGGVWATVARVSGAVIASGQVVVESSPKKVQHREGGIVSEILVRDGDRVAEGDVLLRLDPTVARTGLAAVEKRLAEVAARRARLVAEATDADALALPPDLTDAHAAAAFDGERRLFEARRIALQNKREQLAARIAQLEDEARAYEAEADAAERELSFAAIELTGLEHLARQSLIKLTEITQSRRLSANLTGRAAAARARAATAKSNIAELRLSIAEVDETSRSEALRDLRDAEAETAELVEKRTALADTLRRTAIRSPRAGIVHALDVHTVGGVVEPGATILSVMPASDALIIEAHVPPDSIDQVRPDQSATIRFTAFNQRVTPERQGKVTYVAADVTQNGNQEPYFIVRVTLDARQGEPTLTSGMNAQVFIESSERSPLSFLLKPLADQIKHAMREE